MQSMKRIKKTNGQKKKSRAVNCELHKSVQQHERRQFIERVLSGQTDFSLTNDELEVRDLKVKQA